MWRLRYTQQAYKGAVAFACHIDLPQEIKFEERELARAKAEEQLTKKIETSRYPAGFNDLRLCWEESLRKKTEE